MVHANSQPEGPLHTPRSDYLFTKRGQASGGRLECEAVVVVVVALVNGHDPLRFEDGRMTTTGCSMSPTDVMH